MYAQKLMESLCCTYGWCYGIFWGFHQKNSLLLTFKEAYHEQQMGGLVDTMLLQAHVLGGGVIGEAAFMKNHRWMYSDERQNCLDSFGGVFQDDSEFFYQFAMGIKTIAVISVEPWGVVQLGSAQKNPETKGFVDQVKQLFREMDKCSENEPYSDSQFLDQNLKNGSFMEPDHSFLLPYQSRNFIFPIENLMPGNVFDCDSSLLTSSWPHLASGPDEIMPFSKPMDYESCGNSCMDDEFFHGSNFASDDFSPHASGLIQTSCLSGNNTPIYNLPTNSFQSSVSDALVSSLEVKDSECIWEKHARSGYISKSLFSELGLDQLLGGTASTSPCPLAQSRFQDQSSSDTKRRKTDKFEGLPSFGKSLNLAYGTEAKKIELNCKESTKDPHSGVGESYIVDGGKSKSSKAKKKDKAGSRARPKDRQMIQDRLAELRDLIPNGDKMSIDRLLERTIRHLNFMQSLTKHAQSLNQIDKPKNVNVQKGQSSNGGVTWACEVGDQAMVCPLIVEDLSTPGQMLIEMVCEEQGFFLEIVGVIRGFGLMILKGVMEVDETSKIWGHFLVEAEVNQHVTRHEIFSSLIQLLQLPAFHNFQPVSLPHALQCANLCQ